MTRVVAPPPTLGAPLAACALSYAIEGGGADPALAAGLPEYLAGAAPPRAASFLAGRRAAAAALWTLGAGRSAPVGVAADGAPRWPAGVVGSIAHSDGLAVAAVAPAGAVRAIGLDCEPVVDAAVADEIAPAIFPEGDTVAIDAGGAITWAELVTLAFSAKESLYKCLRPLVGVFFDFADARVCRVDVGARRLRLVLTRDLSAEFHAGVSVGATWASAHGHLHTLVTLPARTPGVGRP